MNSEKKKFTIDHAQELIKQPIEGLLYDLNMLPEVLSVHKKEHSKEWICMQIIIALKEENEKLKTLIDAKRFAPINNPTPTLKIARIKAGYTQQELENICGVSAVTISNLELGKHKAQKSTRQTIEKTLNTEINWDNDN